MKTTQHVCARRINAILKFHFLLASVIVLGLISATVAQAATTKYISSSATGGDCASIGTWDAATKTCTLTTDIYADAVSNGIAIISDGVTLDGNGHILNGTRGYSTGVSLSLRKNVTIRNVNVTGFNYGIYLMASSNNVAVGNTFSNNAYGVYATSASNNQIFNNNFIDNTVQASVSGGTNNVFVSPASGGNYWNTFDTPAEGCDDNNGDFVCDATFSFSVGSDNVAWRMLNGWTFTPPPDTTPPTITSVSPSGTIGVASATIRVDYSDAGSNINLSSVSVSLDGSTLAGCTANQSGVSCPVTNLSLGIHAIGGSISDNKGNATAIDGTFSFMDTTAPSVTNLSPAGTVNTTAVTISASFSDGDGAGIDPVSASVILDGSPVNGCSATTSGISCTVSGLTDATHSYTVAVSDIAANSGSSSASFAVDSTPTTVTNVQPNGTVGTRNATISASFMDAGSGVNTAQVTVTLDGTALTGCTVTVTGVTCPVANLALGAHIIGGSVNDNAGNSAMISGGFTFADSVAPQVTNLQPGGTTNVSNVTISGTFNDGSGSGVDPASPGVLLDGAPVAGCTSTAGSITCSVTVADGVHVYTVSAADMAGNVGSANGTFTIDTFAPTITPTRYISATGGDCNSIGVWTQATKTCSLSQDFFFGTKSGIVVNADGITIDGNGHTISGSGGYSSGVSVSLRTNTMIKNLTVEKFKYAVYMLSSNNNVLRDNLLQDNSYGVFLSSSSGNHIFHNNFRSNAVQASVSGGLGNYFNEPLPAGGNTWSNYDEPAEGCNDYDADLLCDAPFIFTGGQDNYPWAGTGVSADVTAPTITGVLPAGVITTDSATVRVNYFDMESGIQTSSVNVALDGTALTGCTATTSYVSCPVTGLTAAAHSVSGSVADVAGNTATISGSFEYVPQTDPNPPVISSISPSGFITTSAATVSAYFSDAGSGINSASATLSLDGMTQGGCTVTASTISCIKTGLAQGAHSISVSVSDTAGNTGTGSGSFTVDTIAPSISGLGPNGVSGSTNLTISGGFTDTGTGIDTSTAMITVDGVVLTGCTVTATYIGCNPALPAQGVHGYSVSVKDMAGNSSSVSATFNYDTVSPLITDIQPSGIITTDAATISAYLSDENSGIMISSASIQLDGAFMTGCTASAANVYCPATSLAPGAHAFTVTVTDNAGNMNGANGSFTVDTTQIDTTAPVITSITPSGAINSTAANISAYYTDAASGIDVASVSMTIDGTIRTGCVVTAASISCPTSGIGEGPHTASVSVSDNAGNIAMDSGTFYVDVTAPSVFNIYPSSTINSASTTVYGDYHDYGSSMNLASIVVSIDSTNLAGCTIGALNVMCPATGLAEGTHTIVVTATDNAGNTTSGSGSFTVFQEAPSITILQPAARVNTPATTVSASYADAGSGINSATAVAYLDNIPVAGCIATGSTIECPATALADDIHTVRVTVQDNAGNVGIADGSFKVDTVAPSISGILPAGTVNSASLTVYANYSDTGLNPAGIDPATVSISLDDLPLAGCNVTNAAASCDVYGLAEGTHSISVSVADLAGNTGTSTGSFTVSTLPGDATAPVITDIQPSGWTPSMSATISAYYSDAGSGIDLASVVVYVSGAFNDPVCTAYADHVSCEAFVDDGFYGSPPIYHQIEVRVADNSGNISTAFGGFTVDIHPPSISLTSPSGTINTSSAPISAFVYKELLFSGLNTGSTRVYVDGSLISGCATHFLAGPNWQISGCSADNLADGTHTIYMEIDDNAGGTGSASAGFTVDTTAPVVNSISPSGLVNNATQTVYASYSDGSGTGINPASVSISVDGTALTSCNVTTLLATCDTYGLAQGAHSVAVSVADMAGNTDSSTGSFTVDTEVPSVTGLSPSNLVNTNSPVLAAGYSDAGSGINVASVSMYAQRLNTSGGYPGPIARTNCTISETNASCPLSGLQEGEYWFVVYVQDNAGNIMITPAHFFTIDTVAPVISGIEPSGTIANGNTTVSALYTDTVPGMNTAGVDSATVSVSLDGAPLTGCNVNASSASCNAYGLSPGSHSISVGVADRAGNAGTNTGSFFVASETTAPIVSDILPAGTINTSDATISASYSDAGGSGINTAAVSVYLDGTKQTGCTITASSVSCSKAGLAQGAHAISISVADNAGNTGSGTGSFNVDSVPPSVTNIAPTGTITTTSATIGAYYTDATSGVDTASVSVYLDGTARTGCTVGAGSVSCPATGLASGVHDITVNVRDNAGNLGTGTGSFTVSPQQSCNTDYTDTNGATIAVYSDSAYTIKVCQQTELAANTNYYMQVTHPNLNLNSEGAGSNSMTIWNMMNSQRSFGSGGQTMTFTQQSGGPPYRYRSTFRTPTAAGVYGLQPDIRNNAQTKRVYARGWNIRVGSTANYVRTYSNAAYTTYSDTFSAGANVYMEMYDSAFAEGTPSASSSTLTLGTNWNSGSTTIASTYSHPASRVYRVQFKLPSTPGDKYIYARVRNSSSTTLAYTRILIHIQ